MVEEERGEIITKDTVNSNIHAFYLCVPMTFVEDSRYFAIMEIKTNSPVVESSS